MCPKTLALADDDEMLSELLASFLELEGYDVVRFASGDALVRWAASEGGPVDAFLLDIDMPGRDGFQSCRALRDIPIYSATPAVFVSSMPPEEVRERVAASGASGMIAKDGDMLPRITTWLAQTLG